MSAMGPGCVPTSAASNAGNTNTSSRPQTRLDQNPQAMRVRRETVEHPFATVEASATFRPVYPRQPTWRQSTDTSVQGQTRKSHLQKSPKKKPPEGGFQT